MQLFMLLRIRFGAAGFASVFVFLCLAPPGSVLKLMPKAFASAPARDYNQLIPLNGFIPNVQNYNKRPTLSLKVGLNQKRGEPSLV